MDVNFEYYKVFYYVAKYKNFTKAAHALGSGQPNVTRAMNCLEQQTHCTLFIRTNRGVQLTPEGEMLFTHVEAAISQIQTAETELNAHSGLEHGSISIGASETALNIYLLDYKQGTEFSVYASPPLPQAKLVATESDPEYGVTVLAHLTEELEKRAQEFKSRAVRDFYEYRKSSLDELPRILLIIDEFQILFSEGRQVAEPAEKMLNQLLRQGRAYGIHVLLATQTLKGIQSLSMGQLISQIGCRIALACSEEDSAMILGNSNWEASKLSSPPEGIINNSNGAKSANQRFLIHILPKPGQIQ